MLVMPLLSYLNILIVLYTSPMCSRAATILSSPPPPSFSTTFLEFGVRYIVFHHFFHIKVLWLVDRPHLMMKAPMVSLLAHVLGFCVSLFRGINFPLVLWTHLPIFLTLRLVFSIFGYLITVSRSDFSECLTLHAMSTGYVLAKEDNSRCKESDQY